MKILDLQPGTDQFEEALAGYVRAERINDIVAGKSTKNYREYFELVREQHRDKMRPGYRGVSFKDPKDEYRDRDLVPRALQAYELKHGVELARGRIYLRERFPLAAAPDAVDGDTIGITVHIRRGSKKRSAYELYREAVERGVTSDMYRHAIAMMAVMRFDNWIHLQYVENAEIALRKLHEHEVEYSHGRAVDLMGELITFARRTRQQEAA